MRETKSTHISLIGTVGLWLAATIPAAAQTVRSGLAHEYVARGADVKTLEASHALKTTKDGRIIVGGDVTLTSSKPYQGPGWRACLAPDGRVLWSARAEEQPDAASLFLLATDGDSIWETGVLKNGPFCVARFDAPSFRRAASILQA